MPNRLRSTIMIAAAAGLLVATVPGPVFAGDKVAVFKIKGAVPESPAALDMSALFASEPPVTMFGLLEKLRDARSDPEVQAVVFDIERAGLGFAQIQELRTQFEALRAADKDVLVYVETLHPGTLLLGSAATRLVMMPAGLLDFTGLYGEALYFKNMLDKIGLEADIIHCGEFKSAGEPFYRTGPSEAAEKQQNSLLDSMFEQILADIARSRRISPEAVRKLVDHGVFHAKDALEAKLVDDLQYREDFIKSVRRKYGKSTYADVSHDEILTPGGANTYRQRLWSLAAESEWRLGDSGRTRLSLGTVVDGSDTPESGDKPPLDRLTEYGVRLGMSSLVSQGLLLHGGVSRRARFPSLRELYSGAGKQKYRWQIA